MHKFTNFIQLKYMLSVHKFTKFIQLKYMLFLVIINACTHIHMWGFVHPKNATILAPLLNHLEGYSVGEHMYISYGNIIICQTRSLLEADY